MPLHPSPPEDLDGLLAAWRHTVQAVIDLGHGCRGEDFDKPTSCPGWTVKDQFAHVAGTELWVATGGVPDVDVRAYRHIRHSMGAFMEKAVEARRHLAGEFVVAELAQVLATMTALYSRPGLGLDDPAPGPLHRSVRDQLTLRILDVWTHEQDIRQALGRPGNLDSPAAAVFVADLFERLPSLLVGAGFDRGTSIVLHSTGPVEGRAGVRIELDEAGERVALPLFSGHGHEVADGETTTGIALSTEALTRRAAGRGSLDDIHFSVTGDEDVARRALDAIVFVP